MALPDVMNTNYRVWHITTKMFGKDDSIFTEIKPVPERKF